MIVKRNSQKLDVNRLEVGDEIKFRLCSGEKVKALAVRETQDGILFIHKKCIHGECPMFYRGPLTYTDLTVRYKTYKDSIVRGRVMDIPYPDKIWNLMVRFGENLGYARIPYPGEIVGENSFHLPEKYRNTGKRYWVMGNGDDDGYFSAIDPDPRGCDMLDAIYFDQKLGIRPVFCLRKDVPYDREPLRRISYEEAKCLPVTVYKLYPDGTEAEAGDMEDLKQHWINGGEFGVEKYPETKDGWIPVSSGLFPQNNVAVQVTYLRYPDNVPQCDAFAYCDDEAWYWSEGDDIAQVEITAWKPNSSPYPHTDYPKPDSPEPDSPEEEQIDREEMARLFDARDTLCGFCEADECGGCIVTHLIDDAYCMCPSDDDDEL